MIRIVLALLLLISGCTTQPDLVTQHRQILAFGTVIKVTLRHRDPQLIEQAFQRLETDFLTMHRVWHPWEPGALTRTNQLLQSGEWFTASTSVLPLIERAQALAIQSDHYFNPALGKLVKLWGFHRNDSNQPYSPDMQAINEVRQRMPTMEDVEIRGITMRGLNPHLQIDLGGIAKGYGIDQATRILRQMGIQDALIDAGGDLKVTGQQTGRPWKIGIQHPRKSTILASIEAISDESIFTSGDYQRYYMHDSQRRHHIIDPRTGMPVSHTIAVTVIHPDATVADAAATALLAAGEANVIEIAKAMGVQQFLLMTAAGRLIISQALHERIELDEEVLQEIQIVEL